jgi:hypothetical protein
MDEQKPPMIDAETVEAIRRMAEAAKEAEKNGDR